MTELRFDLTANEWVIIAHERAKRPYDLVKNEEAEYSQIFVEDCPFCAGNERLTPPEITSYKKESSEKTWAVRIVPNMFPALSPINIREEKVDDSHYSSLNGFGFHEVLIETPKHNETIPEMKTSHVEVIIRAYRDRYKSLSREANIKTVIIFKNHGVTAGTSLTHPHSQIIATPIISGYVQKRFEIAETYYDKIGRCLYCDINSWELDSKIRLVSESNQFIVFAPYASRYPFELWISPRRHDACFGNIKAEEIAELSQVLQKTLRKIDSVLSKPNFNYIFHTAPIEHENKKQLHWFLQVVPRLWTAAGFEIGTDIYINTAIPEETAKFMREK